ncbi:MAG: heat-inducible transcriptional repressor HrcA [Alphaproteobacteria bacterium]|nr:heat-inducible transcriptional repressor HrcA [Alphaproteobacteria bacterium]
MIQGAQPANADILDLGERARHIFRMIVESYVETGDPVGSRTLAKLWEARPAAAKQSGSRQAGGGLSPATIRNVMSDLEEAGLLYAPRTSAGRVPTVAGFRVFVDGLLEMSPLNSVEQTQIDQQCTALGLSFPQILSEASETLAGLSSCASLVIEPKADSSLKHIEFVPLSEGRALVVTVSQNGVVENRLIELPMETLPSSLQKAANYLNSRLVGKTLSEARQLIETEMQDQQNELDELTSRLIEAGIAVWVNSDAGSRDGILLLRGQSHLLGSVTAIEELDRVRNLFQLLETKSDMIKLIEQTITADGVQVFIGAENELFRLTGCSAILAPYADARGTIIGAIGVIGPTRMNYARIVPMVDYTAKVIDKLLKRSTFYREG